MNVIYLDVLFLTNLTFDLLSVYVASHFTNSKLRPFRSFCACVMASLMGIWLVVDCSNGVLFFTVALATLLLMAMMSFAPRSIGALIRQTVVLLFCLFLTGAVAYYFLRWAVSKWGVYENTNSDSKAMLFSLISVLTGGLLAISSRAIRRQNQKKTVTVKVKWKNETVRFTCLVDSGNLVKDPIDGKPVVFMPRAEAEKLLHSSAMINAMVNIDMTGNAEEWQEVYRNRIRIVPYHTVNRGAVMLCLMPDRLLVDNLEKNALIGVCPMETQDNMGICPLALLT